ITMDNKGDGDTYGIHKDNGVFQDSFPTETKRPKACQREDHDIHDDEYKYAVQDAGTDFIFAKEGDKRKDNEEKTGKSKRDTIMDKQTQQLRCHTDIECLFAQHCTGNALQNTSRTDLGK